MQNIRRRVFAAGVALTAVTALTACSSDSSTGAGGSGDLRIGYMIWDTSVPFYSNLISKANETADSMAPTSTSRAATATSPSRSPSCSSSSRSSTT